MQPTICLHIFIQHKMHLFLDGEFFIAFIKNLRKNIEMIAIQRGLEPKVVQ